METAKTKKKSHAGRIVFWVLSPVWLILLLGILLFGALNLLDFPVENETAILSQTVMSPARRFAFHAAERTVDITIEPSDAVFAAKQSKDFDLDALTASLEPYGLTLEGYAVEFASGCAAVNLRLRYQGFLKIPLRIETTLSPEPGGKLRVTVNRVLLTRILPVPLSLAEKLAGTAGEGLSFVIEGAKLHPRMETVQSVSYADGNLILTCSLGAELFRELAADPFDATVAAYYVKDVPELTAYDNSRYVTMYERRFDETFDAMLQGLEADPGSIEQVRCTCLALATYGNAVKAFVGDEGAFNARFLPGLTHPAVEQRQDEINAEVAEKQALLGTMIANLYDLFGKGQMLYAENCFVRADAPDTPMTTESLVDDYAPYADFLDPAKARIVLCYNGADTLCPGGDTSVKRLKLAKGAKTQGLDPLRSVLPLLMVEMANGRRACVFTNYNYDPPKLTVDTISDATYERFTQSEYLLCDGLSGIINPK